jgi:tetratricopeptide (TPR) repeat protein/O-antigen ligase
MDGPLLAWCVTAALATVFSVNPRNSLRETWQIWTWAIILWALVDALRRGWRRTLWQALFLVGSVVCVISAMELVSWYFGWPPLTTSQQGWLPIGGLSDPLPPTLHRLSIALANATALSAFIALLIPPAIATHITTKDRDIRRAIRLWLVAALAIELLSLSRGGWLAVGTSVSLLFLGAVFSPQARRWWSKKSSLAERLPALAVVTTVLALGLVGGFLLIVRIRGLGSARMVRDALRIDLWRSAVAMFADHPLTGVGPSAFGTALRAYRDPLLARDHFAAAHNLYLNVAAEMGSPGLLAGAAFLLTLAVTWWQQWRSAPPGSVAWWRLLGMGAALVGLGAQSMVDTFLESGVVLPATFFIAAILAPTSQERRVTDASKGRWRWGLVIVVAIAGALGVAWDDWGYARFTRSLSQLSQRKIDQALTTVLKARDHDPWMPLYACHAGYLYGLQAAEGDTAAQAAGLDQYHDCVQILPAGWVDQLNRAALLWDGGERVEARRAVERTTAETPLEWLPWLNRGFWAEQMGDREEAATAYGWVLSLAPRLAGSPFWEQGERPTLWEDILTAGEEALTYRGRSAGTVGSWHWKVTATHQQWDAAVRQIEDWLETHPEDAEAMAWLGEALLSLGREAEALTWLDRAISANPRLVQAYVLRGEARLALGLGAEAERDFRTALFAVPSARAHLGLARLYRAAGEVDQSLEEYSQALQRTVVPHSYDLVLYRRIGWSVPLPQVTRIAYRQHGVAALEWGAMLEEQGELTAAQQVYRAALEIDPFWDEVRQRIGE